MGQIRVKRNLKRVSLYLVVVFMCLLMLFPVYILAKVSLSSPDEVLTQHPTFFIHQFTLQHWSKVFQSGNLWAPLARSVVVACCTTVLSLIIVVPACYTAAHFSKKWRYVFVMSLFFTRMAPSVAIALPISVTFLTWGLLDTVPGLVLANLISQIPFMAWIMVSTFVGIPHELEEAAMIDGAGKMQVIRRVVLPLARQGIAVASMYVWLNAWNEFTYALYLSNNTKTLPIQIYYYVSRGGFFDQATYATILTIPVVFITFVLQRHLKEGQLAGAVKG